MGLKWLDKEKKKNWLDITREERLFVRIFILTSRTRKTVCRMA